MKRDPFGKAERFRYTSGPTRAVMRSRTDGSTHDTIQYQRCSLHCDINSTSRVACPFGRVGNHVHAGPSAAVAAAVRHGSTGLQSTLPAEPARLPHPGAGAWWAEASDPGAFGSSGQ